MSLVRKKLPNWLQKLRLSSNLCFLSAILAAPDAAQIELGEAEGLKKPSKIDKKSMYQSWQISRRRDERANGGDIRELRAKSEMRDSGLLHDVHRIRLVGRLLFAAWRSAEFRAAKGCVREYGGGGGCSWCIVEGRPRPQNVCG